MGIFLNRVRGLIFLFVYRHLPLCKKKYIYGAHVLTVTKMLLERLSF